MILTQTVSVLCNQSIECANTISFMLFIGLASPVCMFSG